jgi:heme-degrading monooxygenase HmoA
MSELVTTGTWIIRPGEETAFVEEWTSFARWASTQPGATTLRLGRDTLNAARFISFAPWADAPSVREWKSQAEFQERLGKVKAHTVSFEPSELDLVAAATSAAEMA